MCYWKNSPSYCLAFDFVLFFCCIFGLVFNIVNGSIFFFLGSGLIVWFDWKVILYPSSFNVLNIFPQYLFLLMCTNTLRVNYYHFHSSLTDEGSWAWRDGVTCPKIHIKEGAKQWLGPQWSRVSPRNLTTKLALAFISSKSYPKPSLGSVVLGLLHRLRKNLYK